MTRNSNLNKILKKKLFKVSGNYSISRISVSEPGHYTCLAVNVYGNDRSVIKDGCIFSLSSN